jgi:hypothetical protein
MLTGRLQARDGAFSGPHAASNCLLGKAGASASCQHFMSERIFNFKGLICFTEATRNETS